MALAKRMWQLGCTGEFGCDCPDKQAVRAKQDANLAGHGTRKKYQRGCRCIPCRRAHAKYHRELRQRKKAAQ